MHALIVDDSRTTRAIIARLLQGLGYTTSEAPDGAAALRLLEAQGAPEMAFVDWNMPEMTGLEFVQSVRKEARYDGMQIVMVTSENDMAFVTQALTAGANEYLMKPFTKEALEEKIALLGLS
ncbi:MAG TPA: response regulator [Chthoniobacteraceae bacterium]|jgi:two-component system chemotaxis response regulator CheY|nr:response regulator [Chthoniobacteraceae bacterium]